MPGGTWGTVSTDQRGAQGWPCSGWIPLLSLSGREGPLNPVGTLMKLKAWKGPGGVFKRERPRMVQERKGCTLALGLDCHFCGCEAPSDGPLCQAGLPLWSQPPKTKDTPKLLASRFSLAGVCAVAERAGSGPDHLGS